MKTINEAIVAFAYMCQEKTNEYYKASLANLTPPQFIIKKGSKYSKVITKGTSESVFCFIDNATGDIFKAASWAAPAKHARGNIMSHNNGEEALSYSYGSPSIRYLKF